MISTTTSLKKFLMRMKCRQPSAIDIAEALSRPGNEYDSETLKIDAFMQLPLVFNDYLDELRAVSRHVYDDDGYILEFGVFKGKSINVLAEAFPKETVWGFDSFEGLPEAWLRTKGGDIYEQGHFALDDLPPVKDNVTLIRGFFDQTLPVWARQHQGRIRLLHIDADLYSSAMTVLTTLNHMIAPGTAIIFDELCDWKNSGTFDNWEECEWKALLDWTKEYGRKIRLLSRTDLWSAAIIVTQ